MSLICRAQGRYWLDLVNIEFAADGGRNKEQTVEADSFQVAIAESNPTTMPVSKPTMTAASAPSSNPDTMPVPMSNIFTQEPIRPRPGESIAIKESSMTLGVSDDGELLTLSLVILGDGRKVFIPVGRSFDAHPWDTVPPLFLPFHCETPAWCTVSLPTFYIGQVVAHSVVRSAVSEVATEEEVAVKLLTQATFGPTYESIADIVDNNLSPEEWMAIQMDEPPSLHRAHYRRRSNQRLRWPGSKDVFGTRSPCAVGSRWNRFAFTQADVGKVVKAEATSGGKVVLKVGGKVRTEVSSFDVPSIPPPYVVCSAGEYVGGKIFLSTQGIANMCKSKGASKTTAIIGNPGIELSTGTIDVGSIPDAYLVNISGGVADSKVLQSLRGTTDSECPLPPTGPSFVRAWSDPSYQGSFSFFVHDARVEFVDATPGSMASPTRGAVASSVYSCPRIPKTFLNEDSCQPARGDCSEPAYEAGTSLVLDHATLRKFFELDGRYVYHVKGLSVVGQPSPCTGGRRHRWVRHNPESDSSGCADGDTVSDLTISSKLKADIAAELQTRGEVARARVRAIDVSHGTGCNDRHSAVGAKLTVGSFGCWTHSHPGEWGVFDASFWVLEHPGNRHKFRLYQVNPIADVADREATEITESVTLTFPSWHPDERWEHSRWRTKSLGGFGDTVDFASLPSEAQGPGMAKFLGAALTSTGDSDGGFEFCGSPGEVANIPSYGNQYYNYIISDQGRVRDDDLDQDHTAELSKSMVWGTVVMNARDQLRQRIAWALSQIFVVSSSAISDKRRATEPWAAYFDIFVRNAFAPFGQVLKEISFHPLMGTMLTYVNSRSLASNFEKVGMPLYPDENFAREIMQLFTLGLWMLNENGTKILDGQGFPIPTYDNGDIMTFARGWTGLARQKPRSNVEVLSFSNDGGNFIDYLWPSNPDVRDVFPKLGLDYGIIGRRYIGDARQQCHKLPKQAFLARGAKYRYLGGSSPVIGRDDMGWKSKRMNHPRLVLNPKTSSLYAALCNADASDPNKRCRFQSTVVLKERLQCDGSECGIDEPRQLRFDPSRQTGSNKEIYYEYVREPCVEMAFATGPLMAVSEISVEGEAMCAPTQLPVAGTACCDRDASEASGAATSICVFQGERVTYATAEQRCQDLGKTTCSWGSLKANPRCGTRIDKKDESPKGLPFTWMNSPCSHKAQISREGNVAIVHNVAPLNRNVKGRVRAGKGATYFRVLWDGDGSFPTAATECAGSSSCKVSGGSTCICDVEVKTSSVFRGSVLPTRDVILSKLNVGAADPRRGDRTYSACTAPTCMSLMKELVVVHTRTSQSVSKDASLDLNEETIFEIKDPNRVGSSQFLLNVASTVQVAGRFGFRNPPMMLSPVDPTRRDALYEIDSILENYIQHPNLAPFIATRLLQLLVTSNPSPRYVQVVARAFKTGKYNSGSFSFGKGVYGDLGAVVASIYLDREARSMSVDLDGMHGKVREPILKVMHFLRAMELKSAEEWEVKLSNLQEKIGQEPFHAPNIFSFFLPDFRPVGPVMDKGLVAPEAQLLDAPSLIQYMNGVISLPKFGLSDCEWSGGFGSVEERYKQLRDKDAGIYPCDFHRTVPYHLRWKPSRWTPADVVSELDLLLTGGKLTARNKAIIAQAYNNAVSSQGAKAALAVAQSLFAITPEFHVTTHLAGGSEETEIRVVRDEPLPETPKPVSGYKAIVYLFLAGGMDSYSALVPLSQCSPANLHQQYREARGDVAIDTSALLPVDATSGNQPCSVFGIHPSLSTVRSLYDKGEAAFIANIGPLVQPLTKYELEAKTKERPPNLFAHNTQARATQTVHAQDAVANGVLGRIGDALNLQASNLKGEDVEIFDSYSIRGTPVVLDGAPGVSRPADVLSRAGVSSFGPTGKAMEDKIRDLNGRVVASVYGETYSDRVTSLLSRADKLSGSVGATDLVLGPWHLPEEDPSCCSSDVCMQLQQVARIIKSRDVLDAKRDAFYVQQEKYDTHSNNGQVLKSRLDELDKALDCFYAELSSQGIWKNVTIVQASEFGRSLSSNGLGTDHGWGGNSLIIGGAVKGGQILGRYPDNLTEDGPVILDRGRVMPTTPWESVWNAVAGWFGVSSDRISELLPNLPNFPENVIIHQADVFMEGGE